jgi:hypothetical protein
MQSRQRTIKIYDKQERCNSRTRTKNYNGEFMTYETILKVMDYADSVGCAVQITHDPDYIRGWQADFKSDIHARVCAEGLRGDGLSVEENRTMYLSRLQ